MAAVEKQAGETVITQGTRETVNWFLLFYHV